MEKHDLHHEFPEFGGKIHELKMTDPHFRKLFDLYHEVDHKIYDIESSQIYTDDKLNTFRAYRVKIKDQIYEILTKPNPEVIEFKALLVNTNPTKNGRSYSKEAIESIAEQINSRQRDMNIGVIGTDDFIKSNGSVHLSNAAFTFGDAEIKGESLYVKIKDLEKFSEGRKLKGMLLDENGGIRPTFSFRPAGTGTINEVDGNFVIGDDYKIQTVTVIPSSDDALNYE